MFASGMAAIATTLLSVAQAPATSVFFNAPIYGGTETLLMKVLPQARHRRAWNSPPMPAADEIDRSGLEETKAKLKRTAPASRPS